LDFEVEHRAGRLHSNADELSRASSTQCGRLSIRERLVAAQQVDSDIQFLRQWLVGANWPVECPPECSRDMLLLWQKRHSWADEDGLIWCHSRGLKTGELA
ncbi:hypothetical protein T08_6963, partial [Trichinella sp. T8]